MYRIEGIVDLGLTGTNRWVSDLHRQLAVHAIIGNPKMETLDDVKRAVSDINGFSTEQLIEQIKGLKKSGLLPDNFGGEQCSLKQVGENGSQASS